MFLGLLTAALGACGRGCAPPGAAPSANVASAVSARQEDLRICLNVLAYDYGPLGAKNLALDLLPDLDLLGTLPQLLQNASPDERRRIARALGRTRDARVVPVLVNMLRDDESVAGAADSALAEMGESAIEVVWAGIETPPEEPAWPSSDGRPRTTSAWCQNVLYQMGQRAVPFLVERIRNGDASERRKALRVLAWFHFSAFDAVDWPADVLSRLRDSLDAPDAQSRLCALRVLSHVDEPATVVAYGKHLQHDSNPLVASVAASLTRQDSVGQNCADEAASFRRRLESDGIRPAAKLLDALISVHKGSCDRALADALVPLLTDRRAAVRELTIGGLGALDGLKAPRALAGALAVESVPALRAKLLQSWPAEPERSVLPLLETADPEEKRLVIEALGRQRVREAVPALGRLLAAPEFSPAAQSALAQIAGPAAVPLLIEAFRSDPRPQPLWWRPKLLSTMAEIGGAQALDFLGRTAMAQDQRATRIAAIECLARLIGPVGRVRAVRDHLGPLVARTMSDPDREVRQAFVPVLRLTADVERLDALVSRDSDQGVRLTAIDALGEMCDPAATRRLTSLLGLSDRERRQRAILALERIYCKDEPTLRVLKEEAAPRLLRVLKSSDEDLALDAAGALATLRDPAGMDEILRQFERFPSRRLRLALALYLYGPDAKKAIPLLTRVRPGAPPDLARAIDQVVRATERP